MIMFFKFLWDEQDARFNYTISMGNKFVVEKDAPEAETLHKMNVLHMSAIWDKN